jgi:TonB-linked SusC/RagA family outer membrane protein
LLVISLIVLARARLSAQQPVAGRATVTGVVKDALNGGPIMGAVVSIPNTAYQAQTDSLGRYTLRNVPFGNHTIDARRIGYSQAHDENVIVNRAEFRHDLTMSSAALSLAAVTTSATVDPTSGIKSPFAVSKITTENMPVASTGVASNLIGKAAGVQITRPSGNTNGDEPWIQFRSQTSPSNRGSAPLVIVDGVPLNMVRQVNSGATVSSSGGNGVVVGAGDATALRSSDIEGLDIESIELIKGAAAAALYGSQASGGVISIKTKRGNDISLGRTQVEFRNEYGRDQIVNMPGLRSHNYFKINDQGQWVNNAGQVVPRTARVINGFGFLDQPFASGTYYNPVDQAFVPNQALTSTARISQNTANGNFHLSYTYTRNPGEIRGADGATNQSARVNVDHSLRDNLQFSFGANFGRVRNLPTVVNFANLFAFEPDINLLAPGVATGTKYVVSPDSNNLTNLNPLYSQSITGNIQHRTASQLSGNLTYRPSNWLTFTANLGYNRQEELTQVYTPPGLPSDGSGGVTLGNLSYTQMQADGLDGFVSATAMHDFGQLTARFTGQVEESHRQMLNMQGTSGTFSSIGAVSLNAGTVQTTTSFQTFANVNSGFGSIALDYAGKYIGDFLLRREGSSLFGPLSRWTNYGRVSGAWLISKEGWWPRSLQSLSLAKVRYSIGSSGNEPDFNDQYGAVTLTTTGFVRGRLGNPALKPETKTEQEFGADFIWRNRVSLAVTYSRAKIKDAIVEVEAPNITGFNTFEKNAGIAHGNSIEGSLEGLLYQRGRFKWTTTVNADRSRSNVETYGRSCYNETPAYVRICPNVPPTQYWGLQLMTNPKQLPASRSGTPSAWEIDNNGYLVPVGAGNHWYEGVSKKLWGTTVNIDGVAYNWGVPQPLWSDSSKSLAYVPIGDFAPTFNYGFGNRFNYGSTQLYFLFSGVVGGQIYNGFLETYVQSLNAPLVDQSGKPDSLKKPIQYFQNLPGGGWTAGQTGQNGTTTMNNSAWVASDTYLKLAEIQLAHSFSARDHGFVRNALRAENLTVQLSGTNIFRIDGNYKGLDQEGYYTLSNQQRIKFDGMRYPLARRFTIALDLVY